MSQVPVAHTCNPSYSGGRDQEYQGLRPARATSSQEPISERNHYKKGLVEWLKVYTLSSYPITAKKRKKQRKKI
jgi:hypothetical protein